MHNPKWSGDPVETPSIQLIADYLEGFGIRLQIFCQKNGWHGVFSQEKQIAAMSSKEKQARGPKGDLLLVHVRDYHSETGSTGPGTFLLGIWQPCPQRPWPSEPRCPALGIPQFAKTPNHPQNGYAR